jgi:hypothetical protein
MSLSGYFGAPPSSVNSTWLIMSRSTNRPAWKSRTAWFRSPVKRNRQLKTRLAVSLRYHGRFECRIPLDVVSSASFHNGVLTVTVPKSREAKEKCDAARHQGQR